LYGGDGCKRRHVNFSLRVHDGAETASAISLKQASTIAEMRRGATIRSYTLHNVLAEKMRSLLQQPIRRRNRRQDVYDIWLLLESGEAISSADLSKIHNILLASCASKGVIPDARAMEAVQVMEMARKGYEDLRSDVR
jgi:predicted nucleotidyltransferase component of viral defense system